jgi:hypothetical protein
VELLSVKAIKLLLKFVHTINKWLVGIPNKKKNMAPVFKIVFYLQIVAKGDSTEGINLPLNKNNKPYSTIKSINLSNKTRYHQA